MAADLFGAAAEARLQSRAPLADRLRPRTLDDIVGQDHLLGPGKPLRVLIEADRLSSVVLWGPPGTGKTTLAQVIAGHTSKSFETLSAVTAGVKDVRAVLDRARARLGEQSRGTILFLDEVHRFNKAQQDALLPAVETGLITLVGATTENPYFEVNPPLLSRSTLFRLHALETDAARALIARALDAEGVTATEEAIDHLASRAAGDGRHTLTSLEVAVALATERARHEDVPAEVSLADAEAALGTKALRYGRDEHYDVISAFIKSVRGSDVDASLYWLATMIEAGEDPRFIVRRILILASEDIGEADPMSLVIATAAAQAVDHVGFPEAQLTLSQAVIHLATAPKSNRATTAIGAARADVRERPSSGVPPHLRDSHYQGADKLGHGRGYRYPHSDPRGWVEQDYRPPEVAGRIYYEPSSHGHEAEIAARMAERTAKQTAKRSAGDGDGDQTTADETPRV